MTNLHFSGLGAVPIKVSLTDILHAGCIFYTVMALNKIPVVLLNI